MKRLKSVRLGPGWILFLCMTVIMAGMFLPAVINHVPLMYGTDIKPEQYFFVEELYNMIDVFFKTGTFPFYSWKMFLGTDFYSSFSYYGNADIYNWIGYLFRSINFYDRTVIIEIMKLYVAGFSMYALLKEIGFKDRTRIIGALCYAFSGWAIFYSGQLMFLSAYSFIPLYFWGMERYLQKGKYGLFIASVPLIILTNWYFFYTISFLSPLYFLYRYAVLHGNLKGVLKPVLKLIGIDLVAIMLAGFCLVPVVLYMTGNDRVFTLSDSLVFSNWKVYLHLLVSALVPNNLYIYGNNALEVSPHNVREICLYAGALTAVLVPNAFFLKDKSYTRPTKILYAVLIVIAFVPLLDSAVHGFGDPSFRWLCVFIIFNIITACTVLEHREELQRKRVWFIAGVEMALCIGIVPLVTALSNLNLSDYYHQWLIFTICALVIAVYAAILVKNGKQLMNAALCCTTLEFFGWQTYFYSGLVDTTDESHSYAFQYRVTHVLQDNPNELNDYLNSLDQDNAYEYYRVYIPEDSICWDYSHNMQIAYQLNGLMVYSSTYEPSFNFMKDLVPEVRDYDSEFLFNIEDSNLMSFLNTKYAIVSKEEDLPEGGDWTLVDDNYRDGLLIYENNHYRPLGTSYSKAISSSEYKETSDTSQFNDCVITQDDQLGEIQQEVSDASATLENITYGGNHLYGTYTSDKDGYMVLGIPYNKGWKLTVDGVNVSYDDVSGGMIGFAIIEGYHEVQMYFVPDGLKEGCIVTGCGVVLLAGILLVKKRKRSILKNS